MSQFDRPADWNPVPEDTMTIETLPENMVPMVINKIEKDVFLGEIYRMVRIDTLQTVEDNPEEYEKIVFKNLVKFLESRKTDQCNLALIKLRNILSDKE